MLPISPRFFRHCFLSLLSGIALSTSLAAKDWTLADQRVIVSFDDQTALLSVRDLISGREWTQAAGGSAWAVQSVTQADGQINATLDGPITFDLTLRLADNSDLIVTLDAPTETPLTDGLRYPAPFVTPGADWHIVFPEAEGMLVPMDEVEDALHLDREVSVYDMSGLIMPWVGITDPTLQAGYSFTIDTPFDASVWLARAGEQPAPSPQWNGEMGRFGYARQVRYHFFAAGGYVAQAKHYRAHVQENAAFSTLRERAKTRPAIDKLIGAVHIYTWSDGRTLELAADLKAAGIDRAWIGWDPNHPPYPKPGYSEGLTDMGFLAGVYDLYRDAYSDDEYEERRAELPVLDELWLHRYTYHGKFDEIVARNPDGSPQTMIRSSDVNLMRYWVCTCAILPHLEERISRELEVYPHESTFLDVTLAAGPIECYSPDHLMTHRQDAAARLVIHRYMGEELGLVVGSESGADYGAAHTEFMHGLMSLHKQFGDRRGPNRRRQAGTPTFRGDWSDTERPSMMLGEHEATERYLKFGLGPAYRVPLYELVYHDAVVTSWRWNDNNHKQPSTWARKDLYNALYGTAPQWNLDLPTWQTHRDQFVTSYRALTTILRDVGYSEMVDHRFLDTDRQVQETRFANGSRVLANFGEKPVVFGDVTIPAGGFQHLSR